MVKVVVGLGNPGSKYEKTRHNAGFWVIDRLANQLSVSLKDERPHVQEGIGHWAGRDVVLVKPLTYMNLSGRAVRLVQSKYDVNPEEIMVVYDDLALEPGVLRIRAKGSAGGHNGIRSIIDYLGTEFFPRLRVGIGPVPKGTKGVDYVLSPPTRAEVPLIDAAVDAGANAVLTWVESGVEQAMSRYNRMWGNPS